MEEKLTVSDSKKLFHEQFPYVIPGLYKRIVDEMIVELNLLNHQSEFNQDYLFCYGVKETFSELTKGYVPKHHLKLLFESLCTSTNFDSSNINDIYKKSKADFKDKSLEEISNLLKEKTKSNLYSSRMLNLGVYLILSSSKDFQEMQDSKINKVISDIFTNLNLSVEKAEKDIGIYKSSINKLEQAKELLEEIKIKEKKK